MEEVIKEFLASGFGYGSGYGSGDGSGSGYGYGYGDGYGYGYGFGDGSGYGSGFGSGYGSGDGSGYGDGIKKIGDYMVYKVDDIQTIFKKIKGNIATGYILNSDFTLDKCFIVKDGRFFAHGKTLREAIQSINEKKWGNLDTDEVIAEFCKKFKKGESYKGSEFFEWHNYLTGSCLMGRESFVKNHDLNMDYEFTVDEFIELTENDYGSEIIKKLKEVWNNEN